MQMVYICLKKKYKAVMAEDENCRSNETYDGWTSGRVGGE